MTPSKTGKMNRTKSEGYFDYLKKIRNRADRPSEAKRVIRNGTVAERREKLLSIASDKSIKAKR